MRKSLLILVAFVGVAAFSYVAMGAGHVAQAVENIRIFINGQEEVPETPPIMVNDYTMVPLRFVAEALGAAVDWDSYSSSVLVTMPEPESKITYYDIVTLKLYSRIANSYQNLISFFVLLMGMNQGLLLASDYISKGNYTGFVELDISKHLSNTIDAYNLALEDAERVQREAIILGLDIADINTVSLNYEDALKNYETATEYVYNYYSSRSMQDFLEHFNARNKGIDASMEGWKKAILGYNKYYAELQSYRSDLKPPKSGATGGYVY